MSASSTSPSDGPERVPTGIDGLDEILRGGFIQGRSYLVQGGAGTGKTIFGFHFLAEAARHDEDALLVHLEQNVQDIRSDAASVGIDLDAVEILDLSPGAEAFASEAEYDVFAPDEVEAEDVVRSIAEAIDEHDPDRVMLDPASQLRHLSPDDYQFRKRLVGLKHYIQRDDATLLVSAANGHDDLTEALQYLTDGCVSLEHPSWGRTLRVTKFRGSGTARGHHDFRITDEGITVYPILVSGEHGARFDPDPIPSGVDALDGMLHGGIERGTVTVITGPTGSGKSTTATQFVTEAARRGETSAVYLFEETLDTYQHRNRSIGIGIQQWIDSGKLRVEEIEPLLRSADEFAQRVRHEVEEEDVRVVVIDALAGYRLALRGDESDVIPRLHALCRYLRNMGVTTILIEETHEILGSFTATGAGLSYLADNILFLRHVELKGELRKVVGVLKKRVSDIERTIREFQITDQGIVVGEPLEGLHGVLGGVPQFLPDEGQGPGA